MDQHDPEFFRDLVDQMTDGVYFVDRDRRITYWSAGAERLSGFRREEVIGRRCRDRLLNHVDDIGTPLCGNACPLAHTILDGLPRDAHVFMHHAGGHRTPVWVRASPLRDSSGAIIGAVEVFGDDSASKAASERIRELEELALLDPLTGLGNRRFLERELDTYIYEWSRHETTFGALFVDIDRFKSVNDVFGHEVGDDVLKMVARTITHGLRAGDIVARYGGEEFVVLARTEPHGLLTVAERLRGLIEASGLVVARHSIGVTVSVGGALVAAGDDGDTLLRRADMSLYAAKEAGRNRSHVEIVARTGSAPE